MHTHIITGIAVASIAVGLAGQAVVLWMAWRDHGPMPAVDSATSRSGTER